VANLAAVKFDGPGYGAIVPRKLAELIPYAKNPRVHEAAQVELLKRSMREFGFTDPILVDETGEIIGGHGRLQAAQALGIAEVPTQVVTGWTEAKKRAYRILENKAVERGGWQWEFLAEETAWLHSDGFDLELTGFSDLELARLSGDVEPATAEDQSELSPHGATDGRSIMVTMEQYNTIKQAIETIRTFEGDPEMSEGRSLEVLAIRFLARAKD